MKNAGRGNHVAVLLPDLRAGGAERVSVNLVNHLSELGYSVDLVLMSASGALASELRPEVRVVDLGAKRLRGVFFPLLRYLRESRPAVLLACMWPLTVIAVWARLFARVDASVVVAEHTTWSRSPLVTSRFVRWQVRASMRLTFPMAQSVVTVSQGAADDLAAFAGIRRDTISVIHNPVVYAEKVTSAECLAAPSWCHGGGYKVLSVGTLKEVKDFPTLLEAFALLRERVDARLLILGEGDCRGNLEQLARKLGIDAYVEMPGFVAETEPYYRGADLHVLSSVAEGLPTVVIEALAAGTPTVCTDCPSGPREILCDGKYGRLVPVGDVEALADAMRIALLESPDREALQARAGDFSVDRVTGEYLDVMFPDRENSHRGHMK